MNTGLYLGPERSGVEWLLDPDSTRLAEIAGELADRTGASPCDPDAVAADLAALPDLLAARHFGVASGLVDPETVASAVQVIHRARDRVVEQRPATWAAALGDLNDSLRRLLRDRHVNIRGSVPTTIRAGEPVGTVDRGAPAVEVAEVAGVLCVTVRRFWGGPGDDERLTAWAAAGREHFEHERILVDLRGNDGGNDGFLYDWIAPAVPEGAGVPGRGSGWVVRGAPLIAWNASVLAEAQHGAAAVSAWLRHNRHDPAPDDVLDREDEAVGTLPAGSAPWRGRMILLTDAATKSSGESAAWALRHVFGARVLGGPSAGMIEYGNIAPYLLPASGLHIGLATKHNDFGIPVELTGMPVDALLDPATPVETVAARFDRWHAG